MAFMSFSQISAPADTRSRSSQRALTWWPGISWTVTDGRSVSWSATTRCGDAKPDPEGLLVAMRKAGAEPEGTFHVGDRPEDTQASRAAGVTAIGAGWGLADIGALAASKPDRLFVRVQQLRSYLLEVV